MDKQRNFIAGFTLVEMMLVLVVMAIMASLLTAVLSDNPARRLSREAERLKAVINAVAEEAVMQGIEFSLVLTVQADIRGIEVNGYQFVRLNPDDLNWQTIDQPTYTFHPLPVDITIELQLASDNQLDREIVDRQAELIRRSNTSPQLEPAVLLLSSGEMTPFTLLLHHAELEQVEILTSDGIAGVERR